MYSNPRNIADDQLAAVLAKISMYDLLGSASESMLPGAAFTRKRAYDDACTDVLATILHGALVCATPL